ncbi:MAG: hypothetical protein K9G49_07655 [Taibaiella sp.]|nr:hypothetical protein [Taibaiella sp.]
MYFLTYKNGFIRYDDGHTHTFFAVVPLLMSFSLFEFRMERTALAKILGVSALLICDYNYENIVNKKGLFANSTYAPVLTYFSGMSSKQIDSLPKELKLNKETISMLGRSTIDIIPIDVAIPQLNNLNYKPRPVTQSYAAYGFKLDSLNANHFFKEDRPEYVMISTWTIDDRYPSWDESLTKAVLRLNYEYVSHVSMNGDSLLTNAYNDYLLLKAKKGPGIYPIFEKLFDTVIGYGDVLNLNFPNNAAVYMKVKTEYSLAGKLKKLLYRPSIISYTQYLDEGGKESFSNRLIRPIGEGPVLVNKYIAHNSEFINFTTGCLHFNKDVKAIKFTAENKSDLNPRIHISFIKLANY